MEKGGRRDPVGKLTKGGKKRGEEDMVVVT